MNYSYNGWPASTDKAALHIVPLEVTIDGVTYSFPGGCKAGDVHTIFSHFLPRYHRLVESLGRGDHDEWGYSYRKNRNADNLSCHSSGTAVDVNASEHPNGKRNTLAADRVKALRGVLAFYEGVLKWGGDFHGTPDEMHYEINGGPTDVARIARKITTTPEGDELTADDWKRLEKLLDTKINAAVDKLHAEHVLILHGDEHHNISLDSIAEKLGMTPK